MTDQSITKVVAEFVANKEEVTATEIAAFLITLAREEFSVNDATYAAARIGKSLLWRGSMDFAKDIIKRPRVVEDLLEPDNDEGETQPELFDGLGAFVRVDRDQNGEWRFKRRRSLLQAEYLASVALLREKSRQIAQKIERYQGEYDLAVPFWATGLTFGEAFQLATEKQA